MGSSTLPRFAPLALALLAGCAPRTMPPAATPAAVAPAVDLSRPIPEGQGRLVIDVVDGPVAVSRVTMEPHALGQPSEQTGEPQRWSFQEADTTLCPATPCVVDVPPGNLLLRFPVVGNDELDYYPEVVHVGARPTVYRRVLDLYEPGRPGLVVTGVVLALVGISAAITGAILATKHDDNRRLAGAITAGAGLGVLGLGYWFGRLGAPEVHPGASIHFEL